MRHVPLLQPAQLHDSALSRVSSYRCTPACVSCARLPALTAADVQTRQGITICATIHCPPSHTFRLFATVLLLQRGNVIYFGCNGQACESYFCAYEVHTWRR